MSNFLLTKVAVPTTPAASKSRVFVDTADRYVKQIDDNGVLSTLNNDGLQDRNLLTNGGFMVQQRVATASTAIPGVSTTTRAGQVADRWAVTTGNATTTSWAQIDAAGSAESGLLARYYGKITQATNAAKFILSQFLIASDIMHLRGQKVRLSIKLKQFVGAGQVYKLGLLQLKAAGTVDVCPAFTSAIGADNVAPTWGTNLEAIVPDAAPTPENGTVNGSYVDCTSTAVWARASAVFTIPGDCKNLVFVLWKAAAGVNTDSVGVAEFQMTQGPDIVNFVQPPLAEELIRCQRFFCKSFPLNVVPAASLSEATAGSGATGMIGKAGATALAANYRIQFPVQMWKAPTVTYFTPTAAGAQCWRFSGAAAAVQTATATRTNSITDRGCVVTATGDAAGTVGDLVGVHFTADAEFVT